MKSGVWHIGRVRARFVGSLKFANAPLPLVSRENHERRHFPAEKPTKTLRCSPFSQIQLKSVGKPVRQVPTKRARTHIGILKSSKKCFTGGDSVVNMYETAS